MLNQLALAEAIKDLTYSEMVDFVNSIVEISDFDIDADDLASSLDAWADAAIDVAEEDEDEVDEEDDEEVDGPCGPDCVCFPAR